MYKRQGENWHGLYAIAFKDSNDYMQTMFGYAYLINKAIDEEKNWHWGYGYTLGVTTVSYTHLDVYKRQYRSCRA